MKKFIKVLLIMLIALSLFSCKKKNEGPTEKTEIEVDEKDFQKLLNEASVDVNLKNGLSLTITPDLNIEYIKGTKTTSLKLKGTISVYYNLSSLKNTYIQVKGNLNFDIKMLEDEELLYEDKGVLNLNLYLVDKHLFIDYKIDSNAIESTYKNKAHDALNNALYDLLVTNVEKFDEKASDAGDDLIKYLKSYPFDDLVFYNIKGSRRSFEVELLVSDDLKKEVDKYLTNEGFTVNQNNFSKSKLTVRVNNNLDSITLNLNYKLGFSKDDVEVISSGKLLIKLTIGGSVSKVSSKNLVGYHVNNKFKELIANYFDKDLYINEEVELSIIKDSLKVSKYLIDSSKLDEITINKKLKLDEKIDKIDIESLLVDPFKIEGDFEIYSKGLLSKNKTNVSSSILEEYDLVSELEFNILGDILFYLNSNSYDDLYSYLKVGLDIRLNDYNLRYNYSYDFHVDLILYIIKDNIYIDVEVTSMGKEVKLELHIKESIEAFFNNYLNTLNDFKTSFTNEDIKDLIPIDFTRLYEKNNESHLEVLLNSYLKDYYKTKVFEDVYSFNDYLLKSKIVLDKPSFYDSNLKLVFKDILEKIALEINTEGDHTFEFSFIDNEYSNNYLYDGRTKLRINLIMKLLDVSAPDFISEDDLSYFHNISYLVDFLK